VGPVGVTCVGGGVYATVLHPPYRDTVYLWPVLASRPAQGRRLSRPGWRLITYRDVRRRSSPIPVLTGPDVE